MTDFDKAYKEAKEAVLPYESWERLPGETGDAYTAFSSFRDYGPERNIRKAAEAEYAGKEASTIEKRYRQWRQWAAKHQWAKRAADYDRYIEKLKQEELRKTIEAQGEKQRMVTGKMLDVVGKKLDTMNPADLTQDSLPEWVKTAIKAEREGAGLVAPNGKPETKQGELNFTSDFEGL
jgi:hypothetical protein